jgi:hypothetical protein
MLANFDDLRKVDLKHSWKKLYVQYADGKIWLSDRQKPDYLQTGF